MKDLTMDPIRQRFPQFDAEGQALVRKAYEVADAALEGVKRENGKPFIDHPMNVALIAADEIGLPAECVAAVFLHEAMRMGTSAGSGTGKPEAGTRLESQAPVEFPEDVRTMVEGLNRIATIKPKDTRLRTTRNS